MNNPSIIDVSSNNGTIDFAKAFANMLPDKDGKKRVVIRTSMGYGQFDKQCHKYAADALAAGFLVSYYHLAYPDLKIGGSIAADAKAESDYFCETIKSLPAFEFLVIDLERLSQLSPVEFAQWLQTFVDNVHAHTGQSCVLYSYADYLNRMLPANHPFGANRLWIANYSAQNNPPIPHGFHTWWMWQYSESGKVNGILGNVDCSKFNNSTI